MIKNEFEFLTKFNNQLTDEEKRAVAQYKLMLQLDPRLYDDREVLRIATNHMLMAFVIGMRYQKEKQHEKPKEEEKSKDSF